MATDEDEPMKDASSDSGTEAGSDNDASDSGEVEVEKVEWLATTRAKRSTAGNRMKSMLANEEPAAEDDDLELLFAEDGDDEGFEDADANDSDVHMDSSSDDEDQDEGAAEDEGEKELLRQAKQKKLAQRKRGANAAIPAKFRKKVRIEQPPTASQSPAPQAAPKPRPKKKSERASWLPTAADMPTRASERQTTRLSKEQLHQQMIEREVKRKKLMEAMERKAKKAEAMKKPPMTQEQRLAEAALVEKRNAKSLNRWEEAEKQREEERLRKIAALQNRKLDGPVVTFWSGIQELDSEQMKHVGKMVSIEEKVPRKKRQSLAAPATDSQPVSPVEDSKANVAGKTEASVQPAPPVPVQAPGPSSTIPAMVSPSPSAPPPPSSSLSLQQPQPQPAAPAFEAPRFAPIPTAQPISSTPNGPPTPQSAPLMQPPNNLGSSLAPPTPQSSLQPPPGPMAPPPIPPPPDMRSGGSGFLAAPSMMGFGAPSQYGSQIPMMGMVSPFSSQSNGLVAPNTNRPGPHGPSPLSMPRQPIPSPPQVKPPNIQPPAPLKAKPLPAPSLQLSHASDTPLQSLTQGKMPPKSPDTTQDSPGLPQQAGKVTKSCIILSNFDETAIKDRQVQTQILFGRKMNKLASKSHSPPNYP
jgi:vacuolar protein sorting-associated protein 72